MLGFFYFLTHLWLTADIRYLLKHRSSQVQVMLTAKTGPAMDNPPFSQTTRDIARPKHTTLPQPTQSHSPDLLVKKTLDAMPHMIWWQQGEHTYCNHAWQECIGNTLVSNWLQLVHPDEREATQHRWLHSHQSGLAFKAEIRMQHNTGEYRWVLALSHSRTDCNAPVVLSCTDIHDQVLAQAAQAANAKLQNSMLDVSVDCIKLMRTDGTLSHMNRSGCAALGIPEGETGFGMKWLDLLPADVRQRGLRALQAARSGKNARFAGYSVAGSSHQHWDNILTPMKDENGSTIGILCVSRDVTLQREAERRLRITSERDELTGLPNRRAFNRQLLQKLQKARDENHSVGLMLIDLDHFKHINDTLGHPAGDHLLRVLAKRLENSIDQEGLVARLGGDEFAVLIHDTVNESSLTAVAQRALIQINAPIHYNGKVINGGMSIGCAMFPRDAGDASNLMKKADTALNDLKAGGRGGVRIFHADMMAAAERTATQLNLARQIVRENNVHAYYQPKVRLDNGTITGFEALLRWHSPTDGPQSPCTVEEAFSDYELATKLAEQIHAQVFKNIADWLAAGLRVVPVSINASPVEFLRDDYAERLLRRMQQHGIPAHLLEVEVTEHMLADRGSAFVLRALNVLKRAGVRVALDDFGTGHSSLSHLRDYQVNALKIDGDFVSRMVDEHTICAIVQTIAALGPKLGLEVIAEGVETEQQRQMLMHAGCEIAQGFLYSPAVNAEQAIQLLNPVMQSIVLQD